MRELRISHVLSFCVFFIFLIIPFLASGAVVKLACDPNTEADLAGYKIYYGYASGDYDTSIDVGNTTTFQITDLEYDQTYYFASTAYDTSGLESDYSNEISCKTPAEPEPNISASPTSHSFGSVYTDSSSDPQVFTISNEGTAGLDVSNIEITGIDPSEFILDLSGGTEPCGSTSPLIDIGASCTVAVTFSPASVGVKGANLTITSNDPDESPLDMALSGEGQAVPEPNISVSPTSHNFGSVYTDSSSAPLEVTISNTGTAELTVSAMILSDPTNFTLDENGGSNPCGSTTPTISAGSSCTVTATFIPSSVATFSADLTIDSDDPDTPSVSVSLMGSGFSGGYDSVKIWLEAEEGYLYAPMEMAWDDAASSGEYILVSNGQGTIGDPLQDGGYAEYIFEVPEAGNYVVWGRVIANSGSDDSFFISVDDGDYSLWDTQRAGLDTWLWDQVSNRGGDNPVIFYLEAGEHTLIVKQREDGTKIDRILVTNDLDYTPEGLGEGSTVKIWLEAEEGYLYAPMEMAWDDAASNSEYILVPNGQGTIYDPLQDGGYAEYIFEVPEAGNYVVWSRVIANSGNDDSFFISVDDGDYSLWDTQRTGLDTWLWDQVSNRGGDNPVIFYLEAGEHTLIVKQREDGTKIDRILVTNDLDYTPEGLGEGSTVKIWLEAEEGYLYAPMEVAWDDAASSGEYILVSNGQGTIGDPLQDGGYAEYIFEVPEAGNYVVWGRVIANSGSDDSFFISVDDGDYSLWDTQRAGLDTWLWDQVSNRGGDNPVIFYLEAGEHTLIVKQREDGTKIDRILVTNDLDYTPEGLGEGSTVKIWLEAEEGYLYAPMEMAWDDAASNGEYILVPNGQGNIYDPLQDGGYAEYIFEVPEAGNYVVWGRVIANSGSDDSFFISVDDEDYSLWDTQRTGLDTWLWDQVSNRGGDNPVIFYLEAGEHTLIVKQREDGTKIDRILVTNDLDYTPEGLGG